MHTAAEKITTLLSRDQYIITGTSTMYSFSIALHTQNAAPIRHC